MFIAFPQAYRHFVQQALVRCEMLSLRRHTPASGIAWPAGGIAALFSAAALCGTLAQAYLG